MSIARRIRAGRKALLWEHRCSVFEEVFSQYRGEATFGDVEARAMKLKLLKRKRRRRGLPQRGDAHGL